MGLEVGPWVSDIQWVHKQSTKEMRIKQRSSKANQELRVSKSKRAKSFKTKVVIKVVKSN